MDKINNLLHHKKYLQYLQKIEKWEEQRVFCRHNMTHFLDVARLSYIFALENPQTNVSKEDLYVVALLHDIGRFLQYENGEPHELASLRLCAELLEDVGFSPQKIKAYQKAIGNHRNPLIEHEISLSGFLYRGDKASRPCHSCPVEADCHWDDHKKNLDLLY